MSRIATAVLKTIKEIQAKSTNALEPTKLLFVVSNSETKRTNFSATLVRALSNQNVVDDVFPFSHKLHLLIQTGCAYEAMKNSDTFVGELNLPENKDGLNIIYNRVYANSSINSWMRSNLCVSKGRYVKDEIKDKSSADVYKLNKPTVLKTVIYNVSDINLEKHEKAIKNMLSRGANVVVMISSESLLEAIPEALKRHHTVKANETSNAFLKLA